MIINDNDTLVDKEFETKFSEFKIRFGKRIKYYRDLKNYTQEYLAELANIEQSSLSNIERGRVYPSAETLYRLASVLGVEPYQFYTVSPKIASQDMVKEITTAMYRDKNMADMIYKFYCAVH